MDTEASDKSGQVDSTRGSVTPPDYGYWKVAHGQAVMMVHTPSQLGVTLAVTFKIGIMREETFEDTLNMLLYEFGTSKIKGKAMPEPKLSPTSITNLYHNLKKAVLLLLENS